MTDGPRRPYHHGDARNALLRAAAGLLEEVGAAHLSLRALSGRAGLSRQAPYNHFPNKEALLAELVRDGFRRLAAAMAAAEDAGPPAVQLRAAGEAYVGFAQGSPALFRLMFSRELVDVSGHKAAEDEARTARGRLVAIIGRLAPADRVDDMSLLAWSLVHGYATLCNEAGIEGADRRADRAALFAGAVAAAARR